MTSVQIEASDVEGLGATSWKPYAALKTRQGKQERYTFTLPLRLLTKLVKRPDPKEPFVGNRKVELTRARAFSAYLSQNASGSHGWTFPPIQLRTTEDRFREKRTIAESISLVEIEVPDPSDWDIQDGQHRVLGVYLLKEELEREIAELRDRVAKDPEDEARKQLDELLKRARLLLDDSQVEVVLVVADIRRHGQMFSDIARNAKGINPDFATMLDRRDVVHRIAGDIIEITPLSGMVSSGQHGRLSAKAPELLGAKTVADVCHGVIVGAGRVGKEKRTAIEENEELWRERVKEFIDTLFDCFPDLARLSRQEIDAPTLREQSLIAFAPMWRAMAIAWHLLLYEGERKAVADAKAFFRSLEPHMRCFQDVRVFDPKTDEFVTRHGMPENHPLWGRTGKFNVGNRTPEGRNSDVHDLGRIFETWARQGLPLERAA